MKKQLLLKPLLTLALVMICGSAWAETANLTFTAACNGSGTDSKGNTWTVSSDAAESTFDTTKGIHYGTTSKAVSYLTVTSGVTFENVTKVVVYCSDASQKATISVKVGGNILSTDQEETKYNNSAYTFENETGMTGIVAVSLNKTSAKKALYVKSIEVTYGAKLETVVIAGGETKLSYVEGQAFDPTGLIVMGYYKGDTNGYDVTSSAEFSCTPTVLSSETTSVEVIATVEGVKSSSFTVGGIVVKSVLFYESFDKCNGTGGDIQWSGTVATTAMSESYYDNANWATSSGYIANKCIKLGTGSALGSAETPEIDCKGESAVCLIFKAGAWAGDEENLKLSATNGTISSNSVKLANGAWTEYKLYVYNIEGALKIKFEASQAKNSRFFLDEVMVSKPTVSISAAKYATLCLPFNFTVPTGVTAYTAKVNDEQNFVNITAIDEDAVIPANMGIIISGEAGTYTFTGSAATPSSLGDNDLKGVTEDTELEEGDYILALDGGVVKFCPIDLSGTDKVLAANKAYLKLSSSSPALGIRVNDATGIRTIEAQAVNQYFDLMGRKVQNPERGIYILNGKKVYVK